MLDPATRSNNVGEAPISAYKVRKNKTKREQEFEQAKSFRAKMKSRLRSLRRLLDRYNDILPGQSVDQLQDEMYALDKSISRLNVYSSMEDCVIRSANRMRRLGFIEGADELYKLAEEPLSDEPVVESLPVAESPKPDASSVNLETVISRLEGLTKLLKSRDIIRDLASADILLNELGLASYFPELGDSQSKLIDAFSYASNRVESIVSKLRGTGKTLSQQPQRQQQPLLAPSAAPEKQMPPKMNTDELKSRPVGPLQKKLPTG